MLSGKPDTHHRLVLQFLQYPTELAQLPFAPTNDRSRETPITSRPGFLAGRGFVLTRLRGSIMGSCCVVDLSSSPKSISFLRIKLRLNPHSGFSTNSVSAMLQRPARHILRSFLAGALDTALMIYRQGSAANGSGKYCDVMEIIGSAGFQLIHRTRRSVATCEDVARRVEARPRPANATALQP
jgi:hypothetical protein